MGGWGRRGLGEGGGVADGWPAGVGSGGGGAGVEVRPGGCAATGFNPFHRLKRRGLFL